MSPKLDSSFFGIDEKIVLTKNGAWLSNGEEILHAGTVAGFSNHVHRTPIGFEIRIGNETKPIEVEDTLYFVTSLDGNPAQGFTLHLNDGRRIKLLTETLNYRDGRLSCLVPHSSDSGNEEAKFLSSSYHELLKHLEKDEAGFFIQIEGVRHNLTDANRN